jgi:hypothetical protein
MFLPANYDASNGTLVANEPSQKLDGFQRGIGNRCPGGTVQPTPDGSAPRAVAGCDPSTTPPGP